jgi:hypothetical protein
MIDRQEALKIAKRISYEAGKSNYPWTTQEDLLAQAIVQAVNDTLETVKQAERIDCPCWSTGNFVQVPCPWHDGKDRFPKGAYWAELERLRKIERSARAVSARDWGTSVSEDYHGWRIWEMYQLRRALEAK